MFCTNCGTEQPDGSNFCSNCGQKLNEKAQEKRQEVCRIVAGWDSKKQTNRWWEAKLITPLGEQTIHKVEYYDEAFSSDLGYIMRELLRSMIPFSDAGDESIRKQKEVSDAAHSRLIAQLIQEGWEAGGATDEVGRIKIMNRSKP